MAQGPKKNTAVTGFGFVMIAAADGSAITSGTVNGYISKDGAAQASLTNSPTHLGNGQWSVDITATEMDADLINLMFTHASAVPQHFTIFTRQKFASELNDFDPSAVDVSITTTSIQEIRSEIDDNSPVLSAILADTNELQTDDVPGLIAAIRTCGSGRL